MTCSYVYIQAVVIWIIRRSERSSHMPTRKPLRARTAVAGVALTLGTSACSVNDTAQGSATQSMADMDPITITVSGLTGPDSLNSRQWITMADEMEENSNGKIGFELFWSGSPLSASSAREGISERVADHGPTVVCHFPQELPVANWLVHAGAFQDKSSPSGAMQATSAMVDINLGSEALREEWHKRGAVPINATAPSMGYDLLCTDPIENAVDMQGRRSAELEELGMVPVDLQLAERYEALQRGVVDCLTSIPQLWMEGGFWEVAKYVVPSVLSPGLVQVWSMNGDLWESHPEQAQQVLHDAGLTQTIESLKGTAEAYARFATERIRKHDIQFVDPSSFDTILAPHQQNAINLLADSSPLRVDGVAMLEVFEDTARRHHRRGRHSADRPHEHRSARKVGRAGQRSQVGTIGTRARDQDLESEYRPE